MQYNKVKDIFLDPAYKSQLVITHTHDNSHLELEVAPTHWLSAGIDEIPKLESISNSYEFESDALQPDRWADKGVHGRHGQVQLGVWLHKGSTGGGGAKVCQE